RYQRGAQFVTGIADETAHLINGASPVFERPVELMEHRVQRTVQTPNLGIRVHMLQAQTEIAFRDLLSGAFNLLQRSEGAGYQESCESGRKNNDNQTKAKENTDVVVHRIFG